jgi:methanogenic corrinoid protein MtbC1
VLVGGAAVTSAQLAHRLGADGWSEHATDAIAWFASLAPVRS